MSNGPLLLESFPHAYDAAHERRVPGEPRRVVYYPGAHTLFVAAGGSPYPVDVRDPDRWSRIDRRVRVFEPVGALALLLDGDVLAAYDAAGLARKSDGLGPGTSWLGVLDDEVHLRTRDVRHRVDLRHGRTVTERMPG